MSRSKITMNREKMVTIVLLLAILVIRVASGTTCAHNFVKLGCSKRNSALFPDLLITDLDPTHDKFGKTIDWSDFGGSLESLVCRCRDKAAEGKYKYFTIGFYGECSAGKNTKEIEKKISNPGDEVSTCISTDFGACKNGDKNVCTGTQYNEYVYKVTASNTGEGCFFEGKMYKKGAKFTSASQCSTCTCYGTKNTTCVPLCSPPTIRCWSNEEMRYETKEIVAGCPCKIPKCVTVGCVYKGKVFNNGSIFRGPECSKCTCTLNSDHIIRYRPVREPSVDPNEIPHWSICEAHTCPPAPQLICGPNEEGKYGKDECNCEYAKCVAVSRTDRPYTEPYTPGGTVAPTSVTVPTWRDYPYSKYKNKQCKDKIWIHRGCFSTKDHLVRGKLLVYWRYDIEWSKDRMPAFAESFVCACAEAAKAANANFFGTHFWGECFALERSQVKPAPNGDCLLADGEYKTKCQGTSKHAGFHCLGIKNYYMYRVLKGT